MQAASSDWHCIARQLKWEPHVPKFWMKQLNVWLKKNWALGHPRETQSATHVTWTIGGIIEKSTHASAHDSIAGQPSVMQSPQSSWQFVQVS
jgi:hypothetical protein